MRKSVLILGALIASSLPSLASAAIVFNVNGNFASGGTLTGTFTTNDAINQVIGINLMSSANGAFQATTYNSVATIDNQALPNSFRLTVTSGTTKQLQVDFSPTTLTAAGGVIGGNSFEAQQIIGAGNRTLTGTVLTAPAAVPEPSTWAMLFVGFGAIGGAARYRRRSVKFSHA